jgi:integrase
MARKPRVPTYRPHSSGQARVTINGQDYLLGDYDSPESHEAYRRIIAEWAEKKGRFEPKADAPPLSVNELLLAYWKYAAEYYGFDPQTGNRRGHCLKDALRVVKNLYGTTPAKDFGPLALKACRREMVGKGWSRTYTNSQVDKVRRAFRWAAAEELLPITVYQALRSVESLRQGRTEARETQKVRPVPPAHVETTLPFMPSMVRDMVTFERLTGCRPGEVCRVRPLDLDLSNPLCWIYRPGSDQGHHGQHKTAHHGHERLILIGPKAQDVLRPYLGTKLDAYCFSAAVSEQKRSEARREARNSPMTPSQVARQAKKGRRRAPGERYDEISYRNAIYRACDKAFPVPERLGPQLLPNGKRESRGAWWKRLTAE